MKRTLTILLALCMLFGLFAACGSEPVSSAPVSEPVSESVPQAVEPEEPAPEPELSSAEPEVSIQEPEEPSVEEGPIVCTAAFSDGQTFEATVGEDFVFFFQCDAPGDMGEPEAGEEGAGITVSEGTVTYSNVGLGGPFSYPTSEKVTISGFTGDFTITITESATNMGATYTIYTDKQEIADAIAFAEEMAAQQAANPMP